MTIAWQCQYKPIKESCLYARTDFKNKETCWFTESAKIKYNFKKNFPVITTRNESDICYQYWSQQQQQNNNAGNSS